MKISSVLMQFWQLLCFERAIRERLVIEQVSGGALLTATMLVLVAVPKKRGGERTVALKLIDCVRSRSRHRVSGCR